MQADFSRYMPDAYAYNKTHYKKQCKT